MLALTGKSSPWFRRAKKKSGVEPVGKIEGKTKPLKTYALFDIVRMCNETGWPVPTPVDVAALRAGPSSVPGVELVKAPGGGASGSADPSEMVSKADLDRRQANVEESERGLAAAREENGRVTLALSIATAQLDERTIRIASLEADVGGLRIEADGLRATNAHLGPENERLARELGRVASDLEHERTNA